MKVDIVCGWLIVLPLTFLAGFIWKWPLWAVYLCTRIDQCFKWIIAFFPPSGKQVDQKRHLIFPFPATVSFKSDTPFMNPLMKGVFLCNRSKSYLPG